jgi:hypothetical protein
MRIVMTDTCIVYLEYLKERHNLGDPGTDGRMILKRY